MKHLTILEQTRQENVRFYESRKWLKIGSVAERMKLSVKQVGRLADLGKIPDAKRSKGGQRMFVPTVKFKRYISKRVELLNYKDRLRRLEGDRKKIEVVRKKWRKKEVEAPHFKLSPGMMFFRSMATSLTNYRKMLDHLPMSEWSEGQFENVELAVECVLDIHNEIKQFREKPKSKNSMNQPSD